MNTDNTDHTYWYEQDMYGNIYRIDYWVTSSTKEQYWKKSKNEFDETLNWIKDLPEKKDAN